MKKIYSLLIAAIFSTAAFAQSQRFVLVEEFTGETCPPCASQNPGFNAIMNANATKGIALKYQNNIPSTGPNFYLYNTSDIATRTTYYANTYSPHGFLDGNVWNDVIGYFTPTMLNNRYAVTSPFTISVSHTLSPNEDSIYTHTTITCTQAYSATSLKLHVAVAEAAVYGYTSPNGENSYENVMRKMLPDANGTTLPATWNLGDSYTYDLAWKIAASPTSYPGPVPIQLRVISFIQNVSTKEVLQTGIDNTLISLDPAVTNVTNYPSINCTGSVAPDVEITNVGPTTLTSADIQYALDANPAQTYNWTGSLAQGASATITLPSTPLSSGSHTLTITITNPNGGTDQVPQNSTMVISFAVPGSVQNIVQNFASTTFPPSGGWVVENPDAGYTWTRSTASHNGGTGSAKMDFYNSTAGNIDILDVAVGLDLSTAPNPAISFDVAHRQYSAAEVDILKVDVSTNCGSSWTTIWSKSGATLASVTGYQTSAFTPTNTQWRLENVSLAAYTGQPQVLVRFHATSDYGNNCYVDNVNISYALALNTSELDNSVTIFPNPANNVLVINNANTTVKNAVITDMLGAEVWSSNVLATGNTTIDVSDFAPGIYFVKINADGATAVKKIVVE